MSANNWKNLFKSKGWLPYNTVVAPSGYWIEIRFAHNLGTIGASNAQGSSKTILTDETFLMVTSSDSNGLWNDETFYLWEDIASVRLLKWLK